MLSPNPIRRRRHHHASGAPRPRPPAPPPPVTLLHVLAVVQAGAGNESHWTFDRDIADPVGTLPGLKINGASPVAVSRLGARSLSIHYPLGVAGGAWSCPADAVGIESVEGYKLAAGSGMVG